MLRGVIQAGRAAGLGRRLLAGRTEGTDRPADGSGWPDSKSGQPYLSVCIPLR